MKSEIDDETNSEMSSGPAAGSRQDVNFVKTEMVAARSAGSRAERCPHVCDHHEGQQTSLLHPAYTGFVVVQTVNALVNFTPLA